MAPVYKGGEGHGRRHAQQKQMGVLGGKKAQEGTRQAGIQRGCN